jgi:hypothetical protein
LYLTVVALVGIFPNYKLHNKTASYFLVVLPNSESLEFPVLRFPMTRVRDILINEWCIPMDKNGEWGTFIGSTPINEW